jgi:hypothetical protein
MFNLHNIEKRLDEAVKVSDVTSALAALISSPSSALVAGLKIIPALGVFLEFVGMLLKQDKIAKAMHVSLIDRVVQVLVTALLFLAAILIGLSFIFPPLALFLPLIYTVASALITIGAVHYFRFLKQDPQYQALRVYVKWIGGLEKQKAKRIHDAMISWDFNSDTLPSEFNGVTLPEEFDKVKAYCNNQKDGRARALDVDLYIEKRMDVKDSALSCLYNGVLTAVLMGCLVAAGVFFPVSTLVIACVVMAYAGFFVSNKINHFVLKRKSQRIGVFLKQGDNQPSFNEGPKMVSQEKPNNEQKKPVQSLGAGWVNKK